VSPSEGARAAHTALAEARSGAALPSCGTGPRVFLDYDQAALDAAYDQSAYAPNRERLLARFASNSEAARLRLGAPERLAYGAAEFERLDLYRCARPNAPAQIFVHGGAWRSGAAKDAGFLAEIFIAAGAHFIALDFAPVPPEGGSLTPMAEQVRRALIWIHRSAPALGIERERLYLTGFSSGAHLAAVALTTDWSSLGVARSPLRAGICISGIYDLAPVRLSARSRYVRFDDEMEQALSPIRHLEKLATPLLVAYGTEETPEFQRQNRAFAQAAQDLGKPVELLVGAHYNHFEMLETLASPYGLLGRAALAQMRAAGPG